MQRKKSFLTGTDQFCGAGGYSQAVRNISRKFGGGIEVEWALNHWKRAIETHSTNFPETKHDCTDISACDPRRYSSTDFLVTSPECTTHSPAGGNNHKTLKKQMDLFATGKIDPATERSRATMWDVCRFTEYHNYEFIVVENVVEAKTRWPLFENWLGAMHTLGYKHRIVYFNSMHFHPTPQSRDRMYVVFWKKGNTAPNLDYTPMAFCEKCHRDVQAIQTWKDPRKKYGKYRQQYVYCCPTCTSQVEPYYYAAFNIIDWTNPGERIGDRKKPLVDKTIKRVQYGIDKYTGSSVPNFFLQVTNGREDQPLVRHVSENMYTQTTFNTHMVVNPPFIIKMEHGSEETVSSVFPIPTQTTTQGMAVTFTPAFLVEAHSKGNTREITDTVNTITAGGVKTGLVTTGSWNAFLSSYYGGIQSAHITEPMDALTTKERHFLVQYDKPDVDDCYYRMLTPEECKLGMAFDADYIVTGNQKEKVKQCGNAVTPPPAEFIIERCIQSLN